MDDLPNFQKPIEPIILDDKENNKGKHEDNNDNDNLLLYIGGLDTIIDYLKKNTKIKIFIHL